MCEYRYCRGKTELVTQISPFKVSTSQPPFQETYEFFSEKVCLKCGRVLKHFHPYGKWNISQEISFRAATVSKTVRDNRWNDSMLPTDAVLTEHPSFLRLNTQLVVYLPFFVPYIVILFLFGLSIYSFLDALSMVIVAVAFLYLLTGTSLSREELYRKIDGTKPQLRHAPDNLLDI